MGFFLNVNVDTKFIRALLFCRMGQDLHFSVIEKRMKGD